MRSPPAVVAFLLAATLVAGCAPSGAGTSVSSASSSASGADIVVDQPSPNAVVTSPLVVQGRARGWWYFEASFPTRLLDAHGVVLVEAPAQAQSNWMTDDFVSFQTVLTFTASTKTGSLVLAKDNPSGLPSRDAHVTIPVRFAP